MVLLLFLKRREKHSRVIHILLISLKDVGRLDLNFLFIIAYFVIIK